MKEAPAFARRHLSPAQAFACGVLWAIAMAAMEGSGLPTAHLSHGDSIGLVFFLVWRWLVLAAVLSAFGLWARSRVSVLTAALSALLAAPFIAILWFGTDALFFYNGQTPIRSVIGGGREGAFDMLAYATWRNAFYGAPFVAALVLLDKASYARALLGEARLSRREAELAVGEAHVALYRSQIQPELLVGIAARLQELYRTDLTAADELMERMTDFLRAAVPAQRLARTTLAAELEIANAYAALWNCYAPAGPSWDVQLSSPATTLSLSSLALVAVMERMSSISPPEARLTLKAWNEDGRFCVSVNSSIAQAGWLSSSLEQSIRSTLLSAPATTFCLHQEIAAGGAALELTVLSAPREALAADPARTFQIAL